MLVLLTACSVKTSHYQIPTMPSLILWVWEEPQQLPINPKTTGVAILSASIRITPDRLIFYPRQQSVHLPANTYQIATIHIDKPPFKIRLSTSLAHYLATRISSIYRNGSFQQLQIDFDALPSEQDFYQKLLIYLREQLGQQTIISITALASWCTDNRWLEKVKLPINYVVPMFFSLDRDAKRRAKFIENFPHQRHNLPDYCQGSIGLATYENWHFPFSTSDSVFVYTKGSWDAKKLAIAQQLHATFFQN